MRLLIEVLIVYLAYKAGWVNAHRTVATECERLGSFFVGDKTYYCNLIVEKEKK